MIHFVFIIVVLFFPLLGHAEQQDLEKRLNELLYGGLNKIESFGYIYVHVRNPKEDKLGLNSEELTGYLRLRYKNNFANIPFKDQSQNLWDMKSKEKVGMLWCGVWTVGDNYPVAYHVECTAGSFEQPRILSEAILGYGNKRNVPETIKKSIDDLVSQFAIQFYKTRGEM